MMKNEKRVKITAGFLMVFMAGFALSFAMYANLLPDVIEHYKLSLTGASVFDMMGEAGSIIAMAAAMFLLDRLDKNRSIGVMMLVCGLMMLVHSFAPPLFILMLARIVLGISGSVVDNLCTTYMADLYGEKRSQMISILHTFFAAGSILGPGVASVFLQAGEGFETVYRVTGTVITAVALLFIVVMATIKKPVPAVKPSGEKVRIPYADILNNRNIRWLCFASAMMAGGYYLTIWAPTYLQTVYGDTFDVAFTSMILSLYYVGMILSRIAYVWLSKHINERTYMQYSCFLSAADILVMILFPLHMVWIIGMFLFGIFSGSQYTAKFTMAVNEYPEFSATVTAIGGVVGYIANMVLKFIINSIADTGHYTAAMLITSATLFAGFLIFRYGMKDTVKQNT